jgi:hypothetical protein
VSPLWRDEVAMYLAPRKVAVVRRARGVRPRVVAATELAVPAGAAGVFARLAEVLAEPTWHDAVARVVVADHPWACYGVLPWPAVRLDPAARLTQARYVLGDTYGDAVHDWAVTLADSPPGRPSVVCAMPPMLRNALEDALAPARLKLVSLQPRLVVAFNAWRHKLPPHDTWFVSLDAESMSAVHLTDGAWDRIHTARLSPDWTLELERLQAFAGITRAAGTVGRIFVDAPAWMRVNRRAASGLEWLEDEAEKAEGIPAHELALLQRMYG